MNLPAAAQWETAAYFGAAHTQNSDLILKQPALGTDLRFSNVSYSDEPFQPSPYYGLRVGRYFRRHWGAEVEFIHLKVFANVSRAVPISGTLNGAPLNVSQPMNSVIQLFEIAHGVNLLLANAVFRQQLLGPWSADGRDARLMLTLRFGAGGTIPHVISIIENQRDSHYQTGSPAIQLAAGVDVKVWRRLHWIGEYKYTRTRQQVDVFAGTATTLLQSHQVVTGPAIRF